MNSKTFYMVYVEGERGPAYKHSSIESAENEAKRLAKKTGKKAYVLVSAKSYELDLFKTEDLIPKEDNIPF